jgi:hypothetical protein
VTMNEFEPVKQREKRLQINLIETRVR